MSNYIVHFLLDQSPIIAFPCELVSRSVLVVLLELTHGFLTGICQSWYMDSLKLVHGFVKVVLQGLSERMALVGCLKPTTDPETLSKDH